MTLLEYVEKRLDKIVVKVHSGYRTIGGNIIEIDYGDGSIVLDLGLNLGLHKKYYSWPLQTPKGIDDLVKTGVAPNVEGLYTRWLDNGAQPDNEYGKDTKIRGVFISHAHLDHYGLIPHVNRNIPVYIGETARNILRTKKKIQSQRRYEKMDGIDFKKLFRSGDKLEIDNVVVTPYHVDHSIPGAYGFKIETQDGVIVYTGDFRRHGQSESLTNDFIEILKEDDVELFITEGTRVYDVDLTTEEEVYTRILNVLESEDLEVAIECSALDIDRFISILRATKKSGRNLFLSLNFLIYIGLYYSKDRKLRDKLDDNGFREVEIYGIYRRNTRRNKINFVMELGVWDEAKLIEEDSYKPSSKNVILGLDTALEIYKKDLPHIRKRLAIFSNSEPFDEESEIDFNRYVNWLSHLKIPSYRIHSSGHISPIELKSVVEDVKPKDVLIIHSEYPEVIKNMLGYS